MKCRTHLVECLRKKGIEPVATGTVLYDNATRYNPMNALNYESSNYYHSINNESCDGWTLDFKREVTVTSYQIKTENTCNYISKWNIQFSSKNDTSSFTTVDSKGNMFPGDTIYTLPFKCTARFFRITGGSPLCASQLNAIAFQYIKFFGYINTACTQHMSNRHSEIKHLLIICILSINNSIIL